MGKALN